jgi:hypothetical protein
VCRSETSTVTSVTSVLLAKIVVVGECPSPYMPYDPRCAYPPLPPRVMRPAWLTARMLSVKSSPNKSLDSARTFLVTSEAYFPCNDERRHSLPSCLSLHSHLLAWTNHPLRNLPMSMADRVFVISSLTIVKSRPACQRQSESLSVSDSLSSTSVSASIFSAWYSV